MARLDALVVAALIVASATVASAEPIDLPDTRASIDLPIDLARGWSKVETPGLVLAATTQGRTLAITRAQLPNTDAWREKTRDAYIDRIERGFRDHERSSRVLTTIEGVPVVDFVLKSPRKTTIVVRVILFRTYALALAIEGPRSSLANAQAIAKTFAPPPARAEGSP